MFNFFGSAKKEDKVKGKTLRNFSETEFLPSDENLGKNENSFHSFDNLESLDVHSFDIEGFNSRIDSLDPKIGDLSLGLIDEEKSKILGDVDLLEKRKAGLEKTVNSLLQKIEGLNSNFKDKKQYFNEQVKSVGKAITELESLKQSEIEKINNVSNKQQQISEILKELDFQKSEFSQKLFVLEKELSDVKENTEKLRLKEEGLISFEKSLLDKENRLDVKDKSIQTASNNLKAKLRNLNSDYSANASQIEALKLKERELHQAQIDLNNSFTNLKLHKANFLKQKKELEQNQKDYAKKEDLLSKKGMKLETFSEKLNLKEKELLKEIQDFKQTKKQNIIDSKKARIVLEDLGKYKTLITDLKKQRTSLLDEVSVLETSYIKQKEINFQKENELSNLKDTLESIKTKIESHKFNFEHMDTFLEDRKKYLLKFEKDLFKRDKEVREKTLAYDSKLIVVEQEKSRLQNEAAIIKEKEKFFIKQEEDLKKQQAKVQAMVLKHSHLTEKIHELEERERDMNLKILSFEKRESALEQLENHLKVREDGITTRENESTTLQLQSEIARLKTELDVSVQKQKDLEKDLTEELKSKELEVTKLTKDLENISKDSSEGSLKLNKNIDDLEKLKEQNIREITTLKDQLNKQTQELTLLKNSEERYKEENEELNKNIFEVEKQKIQFVDKDEDIARVLQITDDLLEHLPKEILKEFVKSSNFEVFEKVFKKYNVG